MGFDFREHQIAGDRRQANAWIAESLLPPQAKRKLSIFVERFPTLDFYKNDDALLDKAAELSGVRLPDWLRRYHKTLAYVLPQNQPVVFQLGSLEGWSPRADSLKEIWYYLGLIGYSDDQQRELLDGLDHLFPVASWLGVEQSTLAIRLGPQENSPVYEFNGEDLWDNVSEGNDPGASVYQVFDTYEDIFDHIVAFQLPDGKIVPAA